MAEETSTTRLKSVWLLGGGAALGVLAICALMSLVVAVGIVWLTVGRSNNAERATQVAMQRETVTVGATDLPVSINPTALPPLNTPAPAPTALGVPTVVNAPAGGSGVVPSNAPDQAVRNYFNLVSQERYDLTWNLLTDTFKQHFNCCAPSYNYNGYVEWWDSVNIVEFGDVHTVSQVGDRAVVYAELVYVMNDGRRSASDNNPYIALVYDAAMGQWRFDDKRATP